MLKGIFISVSGGAVDAVFDGLDTMQRAVGGLIEPVQLEVDGHEVEAFVNEEGWILHLLPNRHAAQIFEGGPILAGDIFVVGPLDFDSGVNTSLSEKARTAILRRVDTLKR